MHAIKLARPSKRIRRMEYEISPFYPHVGVLLATLLRLQTLDLAQSKSITPDELREFLSFIASDELQGRQVFTEGLGLAGAYIADHLKEWRIQPGGDDGGYFQTVKVLGVKANQRSSVTVTTNGQTKTFKDFEGVNFLPNAGGKQTVTANAEFLGYGLRLPEAGIDDYTGHDVAGKIAIFIGSGPPSVPPSSRFEILPARARNAIELYHAVASIGPFGGFSRGGQTLIDFTTAERLDKKIPPQVTTNDEFFDFLFKVAGQNYADLKAKVDKQEPLPSVSLGNLSITINVDNDYDVVQTRLTRNVVGIVEGSDPSLKDTYVVIGAHYDHLGYSQTGISGFGGRVPAPDCPGQQRDMPKPGDFIYNGADDNGSGTVAVMALAKAFATGPKPKRSLMFVWYTGEESGLLGSHYMADYPVVPLDKLSAMLNIDMIGRNRCDDPNEENTVYVIGADRISTELHNLNEDANGTLPQPLKLDYEMNDLADSAQAYRRSDHYSYALKGIPIISYFTGSHRDYHYVTDEVSKIDFPKLAHGQVFFFL